MPATRVHRDHRRRLLRRLRHGARARVRRDDGAQRAFLDQRRCRRLALPAARLLRDHRRRLLRRLRHAGRYPRGRLGGRVPGRPRRSLRGHRVLPPPVGGHRLAARGRHRGDPPRPLGVAAAAVGAARRGPDHDPAHPAGRRRQGRHEEPGGGGGQAHLRQVRQPGRPQQGRPPRAHRGLLPDVRPGVLLHAQAAPRRPGRGAVRGRGLPRPRRPRLDLPRPRQERLGPLGRPQGPAELRRRRRPRRRDRRAALPGAGRAPADRRDLQLRHARRRRLHRDGVRRRPLAQAGAQGTDARQQRGVRPAARRPGPRLHPRDPARVPVPPRPRPRLLRLQARQPHPGRRRPQADRPRRRPARRRPGVGDLRHGRLPGPRGGRGRAERRVRHLHDRPHPRGAVHGVQGLPVDVPLLAARPRVHAAVPRQRLALLPRRQVLRDRPGRPVPVGRRAARAAARRAARGGGQEAGRYGDHVGGLPALRDPGRHHGGAGLVAAARPARRHRPTPSTPGSPASPRWRPRSALEQLQKAPEETAEVRLWRAEAALEADDTAAGDRPVGARCSRPTRGSGGRCGSPASPPSSSSAGTTPPRRSTRSTSRSPASWRPSWPWRWPARRATAPRWPRASTTPAPRPTRRTSPPRRSGMARIRADSGDTDGAVAALDLVPPTSRGYGESRQLRAEVLLARRGRRPDAAECRDDQRRRRGDGALRPGQAVGQDPRARARGGGEEGTGNRADRQLRGQGAVVARGPGGELPGAGP